jgi:hypothetical protein
LRPAHEQVLRCVTRSHVNTLFGDSTRDKVFLFLYLNTIPSNMVFEQLTNGQDEEYERERKKAVEKVVLSCY